MEPVAAMSRGEWSSFSGMYSTDEEADFMTQLLHNSSLSNELPITISSSNFESTMNTNNSMYFSSQESSYNDCRSYPFSHPSHESYYPSHFPSILMSNDSSLTMEYSNMVEGEIISSPSNMVLTNNLIEVDDFFNQDVSNDSIESGENMPKDVLQLERDEKFSQDKVYSPPEISKKRSRLPGDVAKNRRSVKLKKNIESTNEMDGEKKTVLQRKNSMISCCSEDESNVSHELNGKTRASRGSATDPQSLYARKRRERINERLRILQSLVPNGTKVDISTMLEEAVEYVKFLQLQIKLLSSDDLWMYSPIAYNGMDIGLDMKLGMPKS